MGSFAGKGVFPALVTCFDADGGLDLDALKAQYGDLPLVSITGERLGRIAQGYNPFEMEPDEAYGDEPEWPEELPSDQMAKHLRRSLATPTHPLESLPARPSSCDNDLSSSAVEGHMTS